MFATSKYTPSTTLPRAKSGYNAQTNRYSYRFNGQEGDDEIAGVGNIMTAEFWEYDTRLGRRWNCDPIIKPRESHYATFGNNPIILVDPDGLDARDRAERYQKKHGGEIKRGSKDGIWSVDKGYAKKYPDGSLEEIRVTSKVFRDNIFERAHKAVSGWFKDADFEVKGGVKVDFGLTARLKAFAFGLSGIAEVNVIKANLYSGSGPLNGDSWSHDYAGKNGVLVSNGIGISAEVPIKTPWGKLAVGGMSEQSQRIDGDLHSHDFRTDYGVYAIIPVLQPPSFKKVADRMESTGLIGMGKPPKVSTKEGKIKDFYGLDVGAGVALFLGVEVNLKIGFNK